MKFLTSIVLAASLAAAQSSPAAADKPEAVVIPVKTLSGDAFVRLVSLLNVFVVNNTRITSDSKLRTILVYAPKDTVAEVRRVVEELDKPGSEAAIGRNIEMSVTLLRASPTPPGQPRALPPDIEAVAKQLRANTHYKDIEVWEAIPLRIQEGKLTHHSTRLPGGAAGAYPRVEISISPEAVYRREGGRFVRLERCQFNFRIPYLVGGPGSSQYQFAEVGINTSGDFKEGQKSVLGKVSGQDDGSAVFVVITPKVLD